MDYKASAAEIAANKATYVASGGAVILGFTANEIAALGGLVVAVLAMLINAGITIYFKRQHLKLAQQRAVAQDEESGD